MVALVDGEPKVLNLKQMIEAFVRHRREIVTRRTMYLLRKARERYFNVCKRGKLPAIQEALSDLAEAGGHGKSHAAPDGRTALHVAVFARQLKAAVFLLRDSEFGCVDPSVADQNGVTPLHLAAEAAAPSYHILL